jgi:regulatory protein
VEFDKHYIENYLPINISKEQSGYMDETRKTYLKNRVLMILARRDHSELEIRKKLSKWASPEEVEFAIDFAKNYNLIPTTPEQQLELSKKFASFFSKQKMGSFKIQQKLKAKGLPIIELDQKDQIEQACQLITTRRSRSQKGLTKPQLIRYLLGKGFSLYVSQKALRLMDMSDRGDMDEQAFAESDS